ncbi:XRE family transcriptional regulator [Mesorhizobium sp.]|uniref:helix-turn-helix domain-containing protein n=1 Tax=Mesorhizobium sp. TaxID=1871066 RepID=UPI000FE56142|nr:XRE family transcriptional regulator [Mesorhizobium sp.]RWC56753.1 MAG: ImmA/IrrE family metallo-endopeptidase [Mesorhizobium sp.]RWC65973.1 MAG: ImmA/IrrE family metallo-endopeptidase [Mesorhizobium sp.]
MAKLTPFGVELRKLRLDKEMRLLDLAEKMEQSTAFVSAIETGRKQIPDSYLHKVAKAMELSADETRRLRTAAEKTRKEVRVDSLSGDQRELVAAFARKLDDVPSAMIEALKKIVLKSIGAETPFFRKRRGIVVPPMSTTALRTFADKVRSVFVPDDRIDFPIMEVLEFKLTKILPDFFIDVEEVEEMDGDEARVYAGSDSIVFRKDVYEGACRGNRRDRFTACHEFAHFLMHRDVKLARAREDGDKIYTDSEWQADEFAGTLMMSPRHLKQFNCPEDAADACNMNPAAARVMWSKYTKEGKIT